jgi:hypothetical protein
MKIDDETRRRFITLFREKQLRYKPFPIRATSVALSSAHFKPLSARSRAR